MTLSDYLAKEELDRLTSAWRRLTWWQRKSIVLAALPHVALHALEAHIAIRRARFAYLFAAHWI